MSMDQLMALVPIESSKGVSTNPKAQGRKSRWERSPCTAGRGTGKRQRWGRKEDKPYLPPPFIDVPPGLTPARLDQFLREQRLEELTFKLACGELEDADPDIRTQSPPPIYDRNGNRTNTRDVRIRTAMNNEQQSLVEYCVKTVEGYAPPLDFRPQKKIKRIVIPQEKFPDYNFMGLIIGPRGCNHKRLELESCAQISIRGKGTQKEGKKTDQTDEEANMPQHVHIAADSAEKVEKAVSLIEPLLDPCHPMHEDFKKRGLEQLALVNGVQMAKVEQRCAVCCAVGHLAWECPEMEIQSFKRAQVKCNYCGDLGHVTMDCKLAKEAGASEVDLRAKDAAAAAMQQQRAAAPPPPPPPPAFNGAGMGGGPEGYDSAAMDREYKKMMAELTGEPLPDITGAAAAAVPGMTNGTGDDDTGAHPPPPPGEPVVPRVGNGMPTGMHTGVHTGMPTGMHMMRPGMYPHGGGMVMAGRGPMGGGMMQGGMYGPDYSGMQQYYSMYYGMHPGVQHGHAVGGMHHAAAYAAAGGAGVMAGHGPGMAHHHAAAYHQQQQAMQHSAAAYMYPPPHTAAHHMHAAAYGGLGHHYTAAAMQQQHAAMMNGAGPNGNPYAYAGAYGQYPTGAPAGKNTYGTGGIPGENGSVPMDDGSTYMEGGTGDVFSGAGTEVGVPVQYSGTGSGTSNDEVNSGGADC